MDTVTLRPNQVKSLLLTTIKNRLPVMLTGAPGVGKSDIVAQAASDSNADIIVSHPVVSDPTDAKGLPWPTKEGSSATFLPFGELAHALEAKTPTVWFLDDLGQASPATQASFMQLILARRVNGHRLPDCVTFVAATNRRTDRAGVSGILEPVKSRFATIVELAPTLEDWCEWALSHGVPAEVVAFLRFRSDLLHAFAPTADMEQSPSPRTWAHVGKLVQCGIPPDMEYPAYAGAVGKGAAVEFTAFLRVYRDLPNPDAVILDPETAPIPKEPSSLYAIASAVASRANTKNFARVLRYAERLRELGKPEFGVLLIRDSYRREKAISTTPTFTKLCTTDFGKMILGRE